MSEIFNVQHIQKFYGKKYVLQDICLSVQQGDCIGILGVNGCGKSTFLSILSGVLKPDSGSITLLKENPLKKRNLFSKWIGYVPQENPLMEELSVLDNLRFWYADSPRSLKADLIHGIPAMFGLEEQKHRSVRKLSGGMKKRLSIACALAKDPPILILDEPGASLDFVCKEEIKQYLLFYLSHGGTVLITSHEEEELSITNRRVLLKEGNLVHLEGEMDKTLLLNLMREKEGCYSGGCHR